MLVACRAFFVRGRNRGGENGHSFPPLSHLAPARQHSSCKHKFPDQTQKADRVDLLQRSSTRSAYFSTSPHLTVVAVRLVCQISSSTDDDTRFALATPGLC